MNENNFTASSALHKNYIKRKETEAKYSILIGIIVFAIIGTGFYLKLDNISLVIFNLIVIAVPISIYIYMSTFKQGVNMNKILSSVLVNESDYQMVSYAFKAWFLKIPPVSIVTTKDAVIIKRVEFPFNEDGIEGDKKETICLIVDGREFYLLYKYFPNDLLSEFN